MRIVFVAFKTNFNKICMYPTSREDVHYLQADANTPSRSFTHPRIPEYKVGRRRTPEQ